MDNNFYFPVTILELNCNCGLMRTRGTDVLFSSCRSEAGQTQIGSADRDRRSFIGRAVGRRCRRPFGALLGSFDRDHHGAARDALADPPAQVQAAPCGPTPREAAGGRGSGRTARDRRVERDHKPVAPKRKPRRRQRGSFLTLGRARRVLVRGWGANNRPRPRS